jgi:hypothetical protein
LQNEAIKFILLLGFFFHEPILFQFMLLRISVSYYVEYIWYVFIEHISTYCNPNPAGAPRGGFLSPGLVSSVLRGLRSLTRPALTHCKTQMAERFYTDAQHLRQKDKRLVLKEVDIRAYVYSDT